MKFRIIETIPIPDDRVEVHAELEDGRIAIVTLPKADDAAYQAGVAAYLDEHMREAGEETEA